MALTDPQRRFLRGRAHALKAVVQLGSAGLTSALLAETERALSDHELIKLRLRADSRAERDALIEALAAGSGAELVARIGHVAVLYRAATPPRLILP
jgi:RNA-binding protein